MNEFELIQNYFNWPLSDPTIELGIGDDAAIFDLDSGYQLVTYNRYTFRRCSLF